MKRGPAIVLSAVGVVIGLACLSGLVNTLKEARASAVVVVNRPICDKPWLSVEDERATCAIEEALRTHARTTGRPKHTLETKWHKKK